MQQLITIADYAAMKGVSVQAVYKQINRGTLPHQLKTVGKKKYIVLPDPDGEQPKAQEQSEQKQAAPVNVQAEKTEQLQSSQIIELLQEQIRQQAKELEELRTENKILNTKILEYADRFATLADQAQHLQLKSSIALPPEVNKAPVQEQEAEPVQEQTETAAPAQKPRKGFWGWFLG